MSSKSQKSSKKRTDYKSLQEKLERAVQSRLLPNERMGVAFSAGLDSGILAFLIRKHTKKMVLLTVGVKGSADFIRATGIAKKWKMKLARKELDAKEIKEKYALAGKIVKTTDHLQKTIGVVNISVAELAHENGIKTIFVGSGADELFCGYAAFDAHRGDKDACEKLRDEKIKNVDVHDVQREKKCAVHFGVEVRAPFLDPEFMIEALKIPAIENLQGKYGKIRKNELRMLGERMGVPLEIVRAPKKAMQYGSGVAKITDKIRNR